MRRTGRMSAIAVLFWPAISLVQAQGSVTVSTTSIKLTYTLRSEVVPSQQITVGTTGAPVLVAVSVLNGGTPSPFLAVTPTGCTPMCTLTVAAASSKAIAVLDALIAGVTYTASFQLITADLPPSPVVNVTLTVLPAAPAGPTITANPSSMFLIAPRCSAPQKTTFAAPLAHDAQPMTCEVVRGTLTLTTDSTADVKVDIATSGSGLTASASNADVPGAGNGAYLATILWDTTDLPSGNNNGTVVVTEAGASNPAATVHITLNIVPGGTPIVSVNPPGGLTFLNQPGGLAPLPQRLTLTATNGISGAFGVSAASSNCPNVFSVSSPGEFDATGEADIIIGVGVGGTPLPSSCDGALLFNAPGTAFPGFTYPLQLVSSSNPNLVFLGDPLAFRASATPGEATGLLVASDGSTLPFTPKLPPGWKFKVSSTETPAVVTIEPPAGSPSDPVGIFSDIVEFESSEAANSPMDLPALLSNAEPPLLSASPVGVAFTLPPDSIQSQTLVISGEGGSDIVIGTSGAEGLSVSQPMATVPNTGSVGLSVTLNSAGMPVSTSTAFVQVTQPGNASVLSIPVTISVVAADTLGPPIVTLSPSAIIAESTDEVYPVYLNFPGIQQTPEIFVASLSPSLTGGISPSSTKLVGGTPNAFVLSFNGSQPSAFGTINIIRQGGSKPLCQIPIFVRMVNKELPLLERNKHRFPLYVPRSTPGTEHAHAGADTIPSDTIDLTSSTDAGLPYVAIAPDWLRITPASGTTPQTLTISGNPDVLSTLSLGSYVGAITIAASGVPDPLIVPVNLVIGTAPTVAVVSAASTKPGPASPGELISIFGTNIGPSPAVGLALTLNGLVSTTLGNTQVLFDGVAAPLAYAGSGQINAIVPYEIGGKQFTNVTVQKSGTTVGATVLAVADWNPAIFTFSGTGTGQGAIRNQDNSANGTSNPAAAGSIITIFATGEGGLAPTLPTGSLTSSTAPFPAPVGPVSVTIGGKRATIQYAGEAPGEVAGLFQLDVTIPPGTLSGPQTVVVMVGNNDNSAQNVTVAVK
jgi:uncharacterized protein (TIGR03437 family)